MDLISPPKLLDVTTDQCSLTLPMRMCHYQLTYWSVQSGGMIQRNSISFWGAFQRKNETCKGQQKYRLLSEFKLLAHFSLQIMCFAFLSFFVLPCFLSKLKELGSLVDGLPVFSPSLHIIWLNLCCSEQIKKGWDCIWLHSKVDLNQFIWG